MPRRKVPEGERRKHGPKSTLTAEVQAAVITSLTNGAYLKEAFIAAGVNPETGYDWIGRAHEQDDPLYRNFVAEVEKAKAIFEVEVVALMRTAAKSDWRAGLELLKRRAPERWGDTARLVVAMTQVARDELADAVLKAVEDAINEPALAVKFAGNDARKDVLRAIFERIAVSGQPEAGVPRA